MESRREDTGTDDELVEETTRAQAARDAAARHEPDRPPTPEEEAAAERSAKDVDPESGERYEEMAKLGANARGEGRIE